MNENDKKLLEKIIKDKKEADAYNLRKNGQSVAKKTNPFVDIIPKENNKGLDIYVKENTLFAIIHVPVIITESGLKEVVYNDFHIGKNANVIILAGCGIHNDLHKDSEHDGIHRFYIEENAKVKYIEKHYGEGKGKGSKILNPVTEIYMQKDSQMMMETAQIKGVSESIRVTKALLLENATLTVNEKIMTGQKEQAKTIFKINLKGKNSSTHVTSRSVATDHSYQEFLSKIYGNNKCYARVECDSIIKDYGKVKSIPEIYAKHPMANLIHEAAIGKIAGEQLIKLMSLGLNEKEAEEVIIKGFLK